MARPIPLILLLSLAACEAPLRPPSAAGVCWRAVDGLNGAPDFRPFASSVPNLESCAAQLEGLRMTHGRDMVGAYQGRIIYVTAADITAASDSRSQRYRVFTPEQRAKIDAGYRDLAGRAGSAP
mgnify:CR=1 FL=1